MSDIRHRSVDQRTDVQRAVVLLRESPGYDDDRQTLVTHFIDCHNEKTASDVVAAAGDLGLDLKAEIVSPDPENPDDAKYSVEFVHFILIDADTLLTLRETFEILAGSFDAIYDGWAASPEDQIDV